MEERCPAAQTHPVSFFSFSPLKNKQHWVLLAKALSVSSSHSSGPSAPADAQPPPRPHGQPLRGQAWGPPSPEAPHPTICLPPGQTDILSDASDPDHADCAPPDSACLPQPVLQFPGTGLQLEKTEVLPWRYEQTPGCHLTAGTANWTGRSSVRPSGSLCQGQSPPLDAGP